MGLLIKKKTQLKFSLTLIDFNYPLLRTYCRKVWRQFSQKLNSLKSSILQLQQITKNIEFSFKLYKTWCKYSSSCVYIKNMYLTQNIQFPTFCPFGPPMSHMLLSCFSFYLPRRSKWAIKQKTWNFTIKEKNSEIIYMEKKTSDK